MGEIDDIFGEFEVDDDGFLESKAVIGLFVAGGGEEKKEEEKKEEAAAPAADDGAPAEEEPRKRRRRRRPPSKLAKPKHIFYFSNLLNSNLYVKCLLYFIWFLNNSSFGTNNFYQK